MTKEEREENRKKYPDIALLVDEIRKYLSIESIVFKEIKPPKS